MHRTTEAALNLFQPLSHQASGSVETQSDVFWELFTVFAGLGTVVGVVVVSYMFYNAYKYRDGSGEGEAEDVEVGEIQTGKGKDKTKKLALSLTLSAVIVVGLIVYAYTALLYVEAGPDHKEEEMTVKVEGYQFGWNFEYENGHTSSGTLRIPENTTVRLQVTSTDVWHNFGVMELNIKSDAIPGHTTETWVNADKGEYLIQCFELCGAGHSQMVGTLKVMEEEEFQEWYSQTGGGGTVSDEANATETEEVSLENEQKIGGN